MKTLNDIALLESLRAIRNGTTVEEIQAQLIDCATAELKADNDRAEAKQLKRDFWQEGLQQEYNAQVQFESLIQPY